MENEQTEQKYVKLQNILREGIFSGKYKNGEKIPSEPQLMKMYDVTRTTIRKALDNLVNEGLLYKEQGRGTFVNLRPVRHSMWNFSGFTDYARAKKSKVVSRIIESSSIVLNNRLYFKLIRVRGLEKSGNIQWCTIDNSLTPLDIFPGIDQYDFSCESLYDVMKKNYGIYPQNAELELHAIKSTKNYRELLHYEEDTPFLMVSGSVLDQHNRDIERVKVIYNPSMHMQVVTSL